MQTLRALKSLRYGTRRLKAGDSFDASDRDAKLLKALRRAEDAAAEMPKELKSEGKSLDTLRAEYERAVGQPADRRWGAGRLTEEIALAANTYRRRDMRTTPSKEG